MGDYADHVSPSLLPVAATLLALAGVRTGETVADVGCGAGLLTHPAAAAAGPAGRVVGVDRDPALLAVARDRRPSHVRWVRGDAARLPFARGRVDKVLCGPVLHRLADVPAALAEWARVLAPGGRAVACAWGEIADGPHEAAVRRALTEAGRSDGTQPGLVAARTARPARDLPDLLRAAGLVVGHAAADDVTLPFATGASYARWRLSFAGGGAAVAARVGALLGSAPVVVAARVHYATGTAGRA